MQKENTRASRIISFIYWIPFMYLEESFLQKKESLHEEAGLFPSLFHSNALPWQNIASLHRDTMGPLIWNKYRKSQTLITVSMAGRILRRKYSSRMCRQFLFEGWSHNQVSWLCDVPRLESIKKFWIISSSVERPEAKHPSEFFHCKNIFFQTNLKRHIVRFFSRTLWMINHQSVTVKGCIELLGQLKKMKRSPLRSQ